MAKVESGMEAMLDMFIFETNTLLEQLDEILLRTEQENTFTSEDINEIFRIMHTIKGSSAMMGFENLSTLAHRAEDMFFVIRENPSLITDVSFVYDIVFQVSDFCKAEIEKIQSDDYAPADNGELLANIDFGIKVLNGEVSASADAVATEKKAVSEADNASPPPAMEGAMSVRVFFEEGSKMENLRALLLVNKIKDECEFLEFVPPDIESNADTSKVIIEEGFVVTFKAFGKNEDILKLIEGAVNVQSYEVIDTPKPAAPVQAAEPKAAEKIGSAPEAKPALPKQSAPAAAQTAEIPTALHAKQSLISVNLTKLDQLHDIVGEIITSESMVIANPELDGMQLDSFTKAARQLRKLTSELQDTVMSIRMVPLSGVFQKMNRLVRDMKIKLGKDINVVLEGENTEIDKSIADNLNDPLMHLVRNCVDHGIEKTHEERIALGKPEKATITLSAQNASGEVIIVVADDGAGINREKVLAKAKKMGVLTKPEEEYSEKEINSLILLPGFSTKEQVTEFSGRGVGMDVVKANIEKSGGTIIVDSKPGKGTAFIIKIPLTLAIIDGMEIIVGKSIFTIPISAIRESFKAEQEQILHDTQQGEMIMIRGVCHPVLRLHKRFGIETEITELKDGILLLVETENRSVCIFADRLVGEHQVVVKPFPSYLSKYKIKKKGLSGCTIMGDGTISLIVDTNNLIGA